jgi:hypothetical protein
VFAQQRDVLRTTGDFESHVIDLPAFREGCSSETNTISASMVENIFQEIDTDKDGKIVSQFARTCFVNRRLNSRIQRFDDLKAAWPKNESNWAWLGGARGMKQTWSARQVSESVCVLIGLAHSEQVLLTTPLRVHLCGAGYFGGQPVPGVDRGPAAVRAHDVAGSIERLGWLLSDSGDLKLPTFEFDPPAHVESGGTVRTPRSVRVIVCTAGALCEHTVCRLVQQHTSFTTLC